MTAPQACEAGEGRYIVTAAAQRPANMNGRCFYCHRAIGDTHDLTCVLIVRRVRVRMTVEYEVEVPASWDAEAIEFHRNDGSWCANNAISELDAIFGAEDAECMCGAARFAYVGEAAPARLRER